MKVSRKTIDLKLSMRPGEDDKTVKAYHVLPGLYAHKGGFNDRVWTLTHHSGLSASCCSYTLKECRRIAAIVQDMHPIDWTQEADSIDTAIGGLWVKAYMAIENGYPLDLEEPEEEIDPDDMPFSNERLTWEGETVYMPTMSDVRRWTFDSVCEALDGCTVEPDGRCPHGAPSYLIALGMM